MIVITVMELIGLFIIVLVLAFWFLLFLINKIIDLIEHIRKGKK